MPVRCLAVLAALGGCTTKGVPNKCVEPDLELWWFHSESERGPVVPDSGPDTCEPPSDAGGVACGDYTVVGESGGFTGIEHYFLDGEHVATKYWTDVNSYCGGFVFWYGDVVGCEVADE